VEKDFQPFEGGEIFPQERVFASRSVDSAETVLIEKPGNFLIEQMQRMAVFQTGRIQHYLNYPLIFFLGLIFILTF